MEPADKVKRPAGSWASSPAVRSVMRGNTRRDTRPELAVRRALHRAGARFRVDWPIPFDRRRRIDIAFARKKVAVFVDGCFWHGCPEHLRPATINVEFWSSKVEANRARDADTNSRLTAEGWVVLRFWEHQDVEREVVPAVLTVLQTDNRPSR